MNFKTGTWVLLAFATLFFVVGLIMFIDAAAFPMPGPKEFADGARNTLMGVGGAFAVIGLGIGGGAWAYQVY
jgi:hypothetical protein